MNSRATLMFAVFGLGSPALADGFCDTLTALTLGQSPEVTISLPNTDIGAESCRPSLGLGGTKAINCAWPFDYRAPQARAAFEDTIGAVEACLGTGASAQLDGLVNHPDSYDLRTYVIPQGSVAVSLKDKGALQKTYVFLKVERAP